VRTSLLTLSLLGLGIALAAEASDPTPPAGTRLRYLVLTTKNHTPPPFAAVDVLLGPAETLGKGAPGRWWRLEVRTNAAQETLPQFQLRCLTSASPLAGPKRPLRCGRYQLSLPATGERLDYRNRRTDLALLPPWLDFERHFFPQPENSASGQPGAPETCTYLGHVLTLHHVGHGDTWETWSDLRQLDLDPEMLVGTGRNFKDAEGHRLPQQPERRNYSYVPFTEADYLLMIDAGINLFTVAPAQEAWVRNEAVFYLRGVKGPPALQYPLDLYRANYLGPVMFMDEPSILMVGDPHIHNTLRYFSDAAALIAQRTRNTYESSGSYGAWRLSRDLAEAGVNLGSLPLKQWDLPSWETLYETAFYQMKGGGNGMVHEGRYQLEAFDTAVEQFTGRKYAHTIDDLLRYHYAFLRGGTRPFGKFWGTAIYGQCDTNIAPRALTMAYDMGARYFWFWTSDHDHHVPWPEQLEWARYLRSHATLHPRRSILEPPPKRDVAIVIPNGRFLSLENLWWIRVLDKEGQNEASRAYRSLMRQAFEAVHQCLEHKRDFDITVDDGRPIHGYRRVLRLSHP
jgi:hypothetical protein